MVLPVLYVLRYSDWLDLQYCKSYREFSHLQLMVNVVAAMSWLQVGMHRVKIRSWCCRLLRFGYIVEAA